MTLPKPIFISAFFSLTAYTAGLANSSLVLSNPSESRELMRSELRALAPVSITSLNDLLPQIQWDKNIHNCYKRNIPVTERNGSGLELSPNILIDRIEKKAYSV